MFVPLLQILAMTYMHACMHAFILLLICGNDNEGHGDHRAMAVRTDAAVAVQGRPTWPVVAAVASFRKPQRACRTWRAWLARRRANRPVPL